MGWHNTVRCCPICKCANGFRSRIRETLRVVYRVASSCYSTPSREWYHPSIHPAQSCINDNGQRRVPSPNQRKASPMAWASAVAANLILFLWTVGGRERQREENRKSLPQIPYPVEVRPLPTNPSPFIGSAAATVGLVGRYLTSKPTLSD